MLGWVPETKRHQTGSHHDAIGKQQSVSTTVSPCSDRKRLNKLSKA